LQRGAGETAELKRVAGAAELQRVAETAGLHRVAGAAEMQMIAFFICRSVVSAGLQWIAGEPVGESRAELQRLAVKQGYKGEQVKQQSCREY
jgi:hypothetical protein